MNHEALMQNAKVITTLGTRIGTVIAMRDACTPGGDAIFALYQQLSQHTRASFDETNARALLSLAIQNGLAQELECLRGEMVKRAASMGQEAEASK